MAAASFQCLGKGRSLPSVGAEASRCRFVFVTCSNHRTTVIIGHYSFANAFEFNFAAAYVGLRFR